MNDKEHAQIVATDGRPHRPFKRSEALAKSGVEEYEFTLEEIEHMRDNSFEAAVECRATLDPEHYDAVKSAMDADLNDMAKPAAKKGGHSSKKATPPPKPHEIFARFRLAKQGCTSALNSVKAAADKVTSELAQVASVKDRLIKKGWPHSLGDHLSQEASKVEAAAEEYKKFWADESLLDQVKLPDGVSGKEADLPNDQVVVIEDAIKKTTHRTSTYIEKKKKLDGHLRTFVTGPLAGSIKIS